MCRNIISGLIFIFNTLNNKKENKFLEFKAIEVDGAKFAPVLAVVRRSLENEDPKAWEVCVVGKFPLDYAQQQMDRYVNQGPMEDYYAVAEYSATGVRLIGDEVEGINEI